MKPEDEARDAVQRHPDLVDLGDGAVEQDRISAFAGDMAAWLVGAERRDLGTLARVVITVTEPQMEDARAVCEGAPLLAVEAAARTTVSLWPLLRDPVQVPDEEEDGPDREAVDMHGEWIGGSENMGPGAGDSGGAGSKGEYDPEQDEGQVAARKHGSTTGEEGGAFQALGKGTNPMTTTAGPDTVGGLDSGDPDEDPMRNPEDVIKMLAGVEEYDLDFDTLVGWMAPAWEKSRDPQEMIALLQREMASISEATWAGVRAGEAMSRTLQRLIPGMGWGLAPGALHTALLADIGRMSRLIAKISELRKIADALGRYEASERVRRGREGGAEEVVGVHLGGDVAHALPCELAMLGSDGLDDLFYLRLIEHRLVSLQLAGGGGDGAAEPTGKGPIVACVDTSGSMAGPSETIAKALVLAICRRMLPQGRVVHMVLFGGTEEVSEFRLRRGLKGLDPMLDFLSRSFAKGTNFDAPLEAAIARVEEEELHAADLLLVTDGLGAASPTVLGRLEETRRTRGVRIWTVLIGRFDDAGVRAFSDRVWEVRTTAEEALDLVQTVSGPSPTA